MKAEMTPEMTVGFYVLIGTVLASFLPSLGGVLKERSDRRREKREAEQAEQTAAAADIATRFDDASELAKYIREQIEIEVERQVAPIRDELARAQKAAEELHAALRARETQLWAWDRQGRSGAYPMLPAHILINLGLGFLVDGHRTHDSPKGSS